MRFVHSPSVISQDAVLADSRDKLDTDAYSRTHEDENECKKKPGSQDKPNTKTDSRTHEDENECKKKTGSQDKPNTKTDSRTDEDENGPSP